jgi:Uri superfamily endonuclease
VQPSDIAHPLPEKPGTYGLGLTLTAPTRIVVGALGTWTFPAGRYLYVGSAWGPGGLKARLGRHLRGGVTRRWHIDYLRYHARPTTLWLAPGAHVECAWAQALTDLPGARIIAPRFGASDCRCAAHLFYLETRELTSRFLPGYPQLVSLIPEP